MFLNAAMTASIYLSLSGERHPVRGGFSVALQRLPQVVWWMILSGVVEGFTGGLRNRRNNFLTRLIGEGFEKNFRTIAVCRAIS